MLPLVLAEAGWSARVANWGFSDWAIAIVVFLVVCGLVWIFIKYSGIPIPPWAPQVVGLVILGLVIIAAIRLISTM